MVINVFWANFVSTKNWDFKEKKFKLSFFFGKILDITKLSKW
jgi:hypothetical protein